MAKAKLRFTERDVSRAIRASRKAGVEVARVTVDTAGNIIIDDRPQTLFEIEQRKLRDGESNDAIPTLPASSPWLAIR